MQRFGKAIVKFRLPILILALLFSALSVFGMASTRINYDMLTYLPKDLDTVTGQDILIKDFGKGAFSLVMVNGMDPADVHQLKEKILKIDHVDSVVWYDNLFSLSIPAEILPEKYYSAFNHGDTTMMAVFFNTSTSEDATIETIHKIRSVTGKQCFVGGMSALVTDLKDLCEKEEPVYVGIAVALACAAMMIFMDSFAIPFIFLLSIGVAILLNMGTNIFLGEISYLTKAISAVLQLAVTMDYSIFLWHSYTRQKQIYFNNGEAMANAIAETITAVLGSSLTTIAGFLALCFMSFTLGKDLGIVMAKGVLLGLIGCVTTLPALILLFDRIIEKTKHRTLIHNTARLAEFITKHAWAYLLAFALLIVPAYIGYQKTNDGVYYDLGKCLPGNMEYVQGKQKLLDTFGIGSTHMLLVHADTPREDVKKMIREMEDVDGVKYVLGLESYLGKGVPKDFLPANVLEKVESGGWQLLLINSKYLVASDEVNSQINALNAIVKKYDQNGMLIGEAPCSKDMIEITDHDFKIVNIISIAAVFLIILLLVKSLSLPVILVSLIEFAVFVNLGLSYYEGSILPFIAPICISTIQLGSTVDYAILMTTQYRKYRGDGFDKKKAVTNALTDSIPSILVSAAGFFAATYGVALYSNIDIIHSMCMLMARGAVISMLAVIFVLPALFMLLDKIICRTSIGFQQKA